MKTIDINEKLSIQYCISTDLRDEQIKINIRKVKERFEPVTELRNEPIAIVCFGPSLNETWEELKRFKYIMTCSGAHKFLIERGIIPTWHVDLEPREHKIKMLGEPHKDVEYLIASTVHPRYLDALKGYNVKLWHIFANEDEGTLVLPRGEWQITGGSSVGLRCMTLARLLGFTNLHIFGMDGSIREDGSHTTAHPNSPKEKFETEYKGKKYLTTPSILFCAKETFRELDQMPDVRVAFYGDGLVQDMAKDYKPSPKRGSEIAYNKPELISEEFKKLNKKLHEDVPAYGMGGARHADTVLKMANHPDIKTIGDYGCLLGSMKVETEHGLKKIEWIVKTKYSGRVLSINDKGNMVWSRVINWWRRSNKQLKKKWVIIPMPKGRHRLICTSDHPCASINDILNPVIEYVPANELENRFVVRQVNKSHNTRMLENPLYNKDQISALIGIGMGDGYFDKLGRMYNSHGLMQEDYVYFKKKLLGGEIIKVPPSKTGKSKSWGYFFHCPTNAQTKHLRDLFYTNGKKTVKNITQYINEISLAFWYMDDGRLKIINGKPYAELHTEGFNLSDQKILKEFLMVKWGLCASIYRNKKLGTYILHLDNESSSRFFKLISPYIIESMRYKLPQSFWSAKKYVFNNVPLQYSAVRVDKVITRGVQTGYLYDIEVDKTHNFIANRTLVHNCGKGMLAKELAKHGIAIWEYDPCVPGKEAPLRPVDLLVCTDVLEHIEVDKLNFVLDDIRRCTKKIGYLVISTRKAVKTYSNGANTHNIVEGKDWWHKKLSKFFDVAAINHKEKECELHIVVAPKKVAQPETTTVEKNSIKVSFYTPNDTTKWRAETLFSKEPSTIEWIEQMKAGEVMYDVGANIGSYSVLAGVKGVKVFSFEPEAENYSLLVKNMQLNGLEPNAYCLAISDEEKAGTLYTGQQGVGGACHSFNEKVGHDLLARETKYSQGCFGVPLDRMIEYGLPCPQHLKIDVDGLEYKVIKGATNILTNGLKSILVEVNPNIPQHNEMVDYLCGLGFEYDKEQVERAKRKDGVFKGVAEYIFIKKKNKESYVANKIKDAAIELEPYNHIYIEGVFPEDIYKKILDALPDIEYEEIEKTRGTKGYPKRFTGKTPSFISDILLDGEVKKALLDKFGIKDDGLVEDILLVRDYEGYAIPPHTDSLKKVVTALIYLPKDNSIEQEGTSIYKPLKEGFECAEGKHYNFDDFKKVKTMPFRPNSMFAFARTNNSFHGVEPSGHVRDVLLYNVNKKQN